MSTEHLTARSHSGHMKPLSSSKARISFESESSTLSQPGEITDRSSSGLTTMEKVLNEVENARTYYRQGRIWSDKGNQTEDKELQSFEGMESTAMEFERELRIIKRMLELNQEAQIHQSAQETYLVIKARLHQLEQEHAAQLAKARRECRDQLREAVTLTIRMHKEYNHSKYREAREALQLRIEHEEVRGEKAAKKLRQMSDEEERLRYAITRCNLLLLRKGHLSATEAEATEAARMQTISLVDSYHAQLANQDDEIFRLRAEISELEECLDEDNSGGVESRPRTQGTLGQLRSSLYGPPSSAGSTRHSTSRTFMRSTSVPLDTLLERQHGEDLNSQGNESIADEDEQVENAEELAKIEELEHGFEEKIRLLEDEHEKAVLAAEASHAEVMNRLSTRLYSIERLSDQSHILKITKRQEKLLRLAQHVYKPRPPKDQETTVYLRGLTLQMLLMEEERQRELERVERERQEEEERLRIEEERRLEEEEALHGPGGMEFGRFLGARKRDDGDSSGSSLDVTYTHGAFRGMPVRKDLRSDSRTSMARSSSFAKNGARSTRTSSADRANLTGKEDNVKGTKSRPSSTNKGSPLRPPSAGTLVLGSTIVARGRRKSSITADGFTSGQQSLWYNGMPSEGTIPGSVSQNDGELGQETRAQQQCSGRDQSSLTIRALSATPNTPPSISFIPSSPFDKVKPQNREQLVSVAAVTGQQLGARKSNVRRSQPAGHEDWLAEVGAIRPWSAGSTTAGRQ
ncbi:hypothetical protein DFS34DRAFT_595378 [Phlyctochytrium arcticum]|nr:hypothetical protein DFS34DRAFT_595378 [Phlyctochytrium arcticum]